MAAVAERGWRKAAWMAGSPRVTFNLCTIGRHERHALRDGLGAKHGGINAFNEDFAAALSARLKPGGAVFCAVPDPGAADIEAAAKRGVTLIPIIGKDAADRMDPSWVHDIQKWYK